ncbi:MAG: glutathione S-transferase family protein [Rhodobacter sp.]|nr:glutathione S-transferase family protein [Rhodobacter sp.]
MPEIEAKDPSLTSLAGLHLWHAPMSSCSQRVRLVLAELDRPYESHLVDLGKNAHATEEYQRIHPDGLVPALVDDGRLYIESIDIIRHLADGQPNGSDAGPDDLLALADAAQSDLKLLSFEFLFRVRPAPPPDAAERFEAGHRNAWLRQFRKDFADGFDPARLDAAIARTDAGFRTLDRVLSDGRAYLGGADFSLCDIAWMPNVHRMALMDWPFDHTPHLAAWFDRVAARASYRAALLDWQSAAEAETFRNYTAKRRAEGTDVRSFPHFRKSQAS